MIQKVWKKRTLLYWGLIGLVLIVWILVHFVAESKKEPLPVEIISSDYKFLIFGSQNSHGIELYDLKLGKFIPFLIPEGDGKNVDVRYVDPVVGKSGKGFCLLEKNIFQRRKAEVIKFDLGTLQSHPTKIILKQPYASGLALSYDEKRLALVQAASFADSPILSIYDLQEEKIEKTFAVDQRFLSDSINIVWNEDNKGIVLWDNITQFPAIKIDTITGPICLIISPSITKANICLQWMVKRKVFMCMT